MEIDALPIPNADDITLLLSRAAEGDDDAKKVAWEFFQADTRRLAERLVARESNNTDLQPTLVIHEIWLRLFSTIDARQINGEDEPAWSHRGHFWGAIVRTAEQFLVDEHRRRSARKRGGGWSKVPMELAAGELADLESVESVDIPDLLEALRKLREAHPEEAQVAEHRYLLSMTVAQTAAALDRSPRWVNQKWHLARCWLRRELEIGTAPSEEDASDSS